MYVVLVHKINEDSDMLFFGEVFLILLITYLCKGISGLVEIIVRLLRVLRWSRSTKISRRVYR